MGMPLTAHVWTAAEARALPDDGKRYEVIDGELLVTPAPRLVHQRTVLRLSRVIDEYVRAHRIGETLCSPADIELSLDTLVQPDIFVAPPVNGRRPHDWTEIRGLLLAVEVLSPSTARYDRVTKRRFFSHVGVGEYWIVDADARVVERWRAGESRPELVDERLEWRPEGAPESLVLDLAGFFSDVQGDAF